MLSITFFKKLAFPTLFFLFLFLLWEIIPLFFNHFTFILPAPSTIFSGIIKNFDRFKFHTIVTLKEILAGSLLAFLIAAPTAWLMNEYKAAKLTIQPLFVISQSIPLFAIAPIMIIWFGWSFTAIIIPTALMVFFPLALTLYQGLRATPHEWIEFFKLHKASKWKIFIKLSIPYCLPHLFSGLKISAAVAAIGAVTAEWTGAQEGLGMLIQESRRSTDLATTFGAIFFVVFLSLSLYLLTVIIEYFVCNKPKKCLSKKALLNFILMSLLLVSSGCSNDNTQENKSPQVKLLLDWLPNPNHVPIYAGIAKGFFEEKNISLQVQKIFDPSDTIPYITSNQTDLAIYYMPQTLQAVANGAQCKVIGKLIPTPLDGLLFLKSSHIHSPADLNNKVLGYSMGSLSTTYVQEFCDKLGIQLKNKVKIGCDLVAALSTKQVDVIQGVCWNIESEQLRALKLETDYFKITDLGIPSYEELIILANTTIYQNTTLVKAFQEALSKSIAFSKEHPDEAFALYLNANTDKMNYTQNWEEKAWKNTYPLFAESQTFDSEGWQNFANWMLAKKLISQSIDVRILQ